MTEEELYYCEICADFFATEEELEEHMSTHSGENSEEVLSSENLCPSDYKTVIQGLYLSTKYEEERLKKKYGYKIPKSRENLSIKSAPERLEEELQIRNAMCTYVRIAQGEENFDPSNWVVAPRETIDLRDFKLGENIFSVKALTKEGHDAVKARLEKEKMTTDTLTRIIKGEYDEPFPEENSEKLSKSADLYVKATERLWKVFEPLWNRGPQGGQDRLTDFNESIILSVGREIFHRMRCPIPECDFKVNRNLSRKEKYVELVKHFLEDHLDKVEGTSQLSIVKRFTAAPAEDTMELAKKAFSNPIEKGDDEAASGKLKSNQTGASNPEQCRGNLEKLSDLENRLPKDTLPSVEERRNMFKDLKSNSQRGTMDLARALSDVAPTPEQLSCLKDTYKAFMYEQGKLTVCKACRAKFDSWREFLTHLRQQHPKLHKNPQSYRGFYQNKE